MTIAINEIERTYTNFGMHAEQALAFSLTGEMRKHDHVAFDKGSDIPEYGMSVKSSAFTLMSGNLCTAQDFDGILTEYFARTASHTIAYVTQSMVAYVMDDALFEQFIRKFCRLERESSRNGGRMKIKMRRESSKTIAWLNEMVR